MQTIAKATINFGKINYTGTGARTPEYVELSICGEIWNHPHTDIICGGQCLDEMHKYLRNNATFAKIYQIWKRYHLNGMRAGTPEQEEAIAKWKAAGNKYDYGAACAYLQSIGLYDVPFTGKACGKVYNGERYKYGHGWIVEELPDDVLLYVEHLIDTAHANA